MSGKPEDREVCALTLKMFSGKKVRAQGNGEKIAVVECVEIVIYETYFTALHTLSPRPTHTNIDRKVYEHRDT